MEATIRSLQLGMGWFPEQAGGLNRFYYHLLEHLPSVGVEVQGLVAGSPDVAKRTEGRVQAFAARTAPLPLRWLRARQAASRLLGTQEIDLVCTHFALYAVSLADLVPPRPLVVHFQGPWAMESEVEGQNKFVVRIKHGVEHEVFRRAQRFITLSEAFRQRLHKQYQVPLDRIVVGPGGVDVAAYATEGTRQDARERLGWPTDRPIVVAVRRLARRMGLENLVEAMKAVCTAVPEALLLIAGKGPIKEELEAQIEALEIGRAHV